MKELYFDLLKRDEEFDPDLFMRWVAFASKSSLGLLSLFSRYSIDSKYLSDFVYLSRPIDRDIKIDSGKFSDFEGCLNSEIDCLRADLAQRQCNIGFFEQDPVVLHIGDCFKVDSSVYPVDCAIDQQIERASAFFGLIKNYLKDCKTEKDFNPETAGICANTCDYLDYLKMLKRYSNMLVPIADLRAAKEIVEEAFSS